MIPASGNPLPAISSDEPLTVALNEPGQLTLPETMSLVNASHVPAVVSIHGPVPGGACPFGTEHTYTLPMLGAVVLYFESPSGNAAQFNGPDEVVAGGHVYEPVDVMVDAAAVAVALAAGTDAPEPPQPPSTSASVRMQVKCLFIGRSVRPLTWPVLRTRCA